MDDKEIIGKKIRFERQKREMTLSELAIKTGKTKSYWSQVERGLIEPSIKALRGISEVLNVPIFYFLMNNRKNKGIVKKSERKELRFKESQLKFELLTPDLNHEMEILQIELEPGASTYEKPISHKGEEFILVLTGKMEIQLADEFHVLEEGDSIYFLCSTPHKTTNIADQKLVYVAAVTPPYF